MKQRRAAALLCVLLSHALIVFLMMRLRAAADRDVFPDPLVTGPIHIFLEEPQPVAVAPPAERVISAQPAPPRVQVPVAAVPAPAAAAESGAITYPENVDWPLEGKRAVKRLLDAEAEAERVAKMFSGPQGTWASLTPRERSELKKFKWKKGVVPERDENGNTIVHLSEGCVLVNFSFIGCALGKAPVYGDLFKDMRKYFDEQRLPETGNGNGR